MCRQRSLRGSVPWCSLFLLTLTLKLEMLLFKIVNNGSFGLKYFGLRCYPPKNYMRPAANKWLLDLPGEVRYDTFLLRLLSIVDGWITYQKIEHVILT